MYKLTEATCYEDMDKYIKDKKWDSKTIASKIAWYGKSCGLIESTVASKKESTSVLHEQIYHWLCDYQEGNKKVDRGIYKDSIVSLFREGYNISEAYDILKNKGTSVSKVTLYKYADNYGMYEMGLELYDSHLKGYQGFEENHPVWMTYEIFKELSSILEEYGCHQKEAARDSMNKYLKESGHPKVAREYIWQIGCYDEWLREGGYLYAIDGFPKLEYLSVFTDEDGKVPEYNVHYFQESDGSVVNRYRFLFNE